MTVSSTGCSRRRMPSYLPSRMPLNARTTSSTLMPSRRREYCHFTDTPCLPLLKHLLQVQGGAIK